MADFSIELDERSRKGFNKSLKKFNKKTELAIFEILKRVALNILSDSVKNLKEHGNIASGQLAKNGHFKRVKGEIATEVIYTGYAGAVEFGRKAGKFPPVNTIAQWVKRKGIATGKDIQRVAFLIARSIAKNGTKPHPFLLPAYYKNEKSLRNKIIRAINKVNK